MLKVRNDFLFAKLQEIFLDIHLTKLSGVLKNFFRQIPLVSFDGISVMEASKTKLVI